MEDLLLLLFVLAPFLFGTALYAFGRVIKKKSRHGWTLLASGNFLVLLFIVSWVFPLGEIYYRFFCDTTESFSTTKLSQRWYQRHWKENANGFRDDRDYPMKIAAGKRRVSFVGDSFTAGQGVKHLQKLFPKEIASLHPDWEIQILARPGADTGNELEMMREAFEHGYEVNDVVLVYCLNDISDMMEDWLRVAHQLSSDTENKGWLRQNSFFLDSMYYRFVLVRNPYLSGYFPFIRAAYQGRLWEQQKKRLTEFSNLVRDHGGKLCVVTFPFFNKLGTDYPERFIHAQLGEFWDKLKVPHLDLLPIYSNIDPARLIVNKRDAHPNEHAHALAASAIDDFLNKQVTNSVEQLK